MAHVHAWEKYGGSVEVTVPDNLKAGVTRACYHDPEVNPSYAELASHYQTMVLPARPGKPRGLGLFRSSSDDSRGGRRAGPPGRRWR